MPDRSLELYAVEDSTQEGMLPFLQEGSIHREQHRGQRHKDKLHRGLALLEKARCSSKYSRWGLGVW